ncbi:MAG TPA: tetratricopeptide repeat protein, partial [Bdellovibrionales bacterium]|nr:tetratricopeptide repeat protein [Bdellovibrionales bacterium]
MVIALVLIAGPALGARDDVMFKRAMTLAQKKKLKSARKIMMDLTRRNPRNGLYWFNLGNIFYLLADWPRAEDAYYNVILVKSPLAPAAELYLAKTLMEKGDVKQAMSYLGNLEQQPLPPGLRKDLETERDEFLERVRKMAVARYRARRNDETLDLLQTVNRQYPRADHYVLIGMVWLRLAMPNRARQAFRIARDISRETDTLDEAEQFLTQIREGTWDADRVFFPYVDLAAGYNSNIFSEAE